jgi:ectoine hydroxylase-related dioxygenase (phytanoyl-CoA dioxygenase family)
MDALLNKAAKQTYLQPFTDDGLIVFKNFLNVDQLRVLGEEIALIRELVMRKISSMQRPLRAYSDISERELNRLDYRCGFTAEIFSEIAKPIFEIIRTLSPAMTFRQYWGAIPALAGSKETDLHRDIYPLLKSTTGQNIGEFDAMLPPYYFTVLMPLVKITEENGPTQLVKGSHRQLIVEESQAEIYAPLLSPGDVLIFDGRVLHRGSANNSNEERLVAYITFVADWYHDQTFAINDYLFPELAVPGR